MSPCIESKRTLGFPQHRLVGIGDEANARDRGMFKYCIDMPVDFFEQAFDITEVAIRRQFNRLHPFGNFSMPNHVLGR
jgi:hypothetical protein